MSQSKDEAESGRDQAKANKAKSKLKRNRRTSAPSLATLEGRRMLTGGFTTLMAPTAPDAPAELFQTTAANTTLATTVAADAVTISAQGPNLTYQGDFIPPAPVGVATIEPAFGGDWVYSGSDALLGPIGPLAYSGNADALGGSFAAISARPGPVFNAQTLPAFDVQTLPAFDGAAGSPIFDAQTLPAFDVQTLPAFDAQTLPAFDAQTLPAFDSQTTGFSQQAELDAAFQKQFADTQAIQDKSEVTPKLMATLRKAREKVAGEAGEADEALVQTLQTDIQAVQASGTFTDEQKQQLKDAYTAVLKSAGVPDGSIAELFAAQDAVVSASNVTADDLKTLADDQAAVQTLLDAQSEYFAQNAPVAFDGGMHRASILPAYDMVTMGEPVPITTSLAGSGSGAGVDPADLAATSQPVSIVSQPGGAGDQPVLISAPIGGGAGGGIGVGGLNRQLGGRTGPAGFQTGGLETIRQNGGLNLVRGGGLTRRVTSRVGAGGGGQIVSGRTVGNGGGNKSIGGATDATSINAARAAARLRQGGFGGMRIANRSSGDGS